MMYKGLEIFKGVCCGHDVAFRDGRFRHTNPTRDEKSRFFTQYCNDPECLHRNTRPCNIEDHVEELKKQFEAMDGALKEEIRVEVEHNPENKSTPAKSNVPIIEKIQVMPPEIQDQQEESKTNSLNFYNHSERAAFIREKLQPYLDSPEIPYEKCREIAREVGCTSENVRRHFKRFQEEDLYLKEKQKVSGKENSNQLFFRNRSERIAYIRKQLQPFLETKRTPYVKCEEIALKVGCTAENVRQHFQRLLRESHKKSPAAKKSSENDPSPEQHQEQGQEKVTEEINLEAIKKIVKDLNEAAKTSKEDLLKTEIKLIVKKGDESQRRLMVETLKAEIYRFSNAFMSMKISKEKGGDIKIECLISEWFDLGGN